jgi:hypothetical protein
LLGRYLDFARGDIVLRAVGRYVAAHKVPNSPSIN